MSKIEGRHPGGAWMLAAALSLSLAACGGGSGAEDAAAVATTDDGAPAALEALDLAAQSPDRLPDEERAALSALDPTLGDDVAYVVLLNEASVAAEAGRSKSVLDARASHRSRTAAAVQSLAMRAVASAGGRVQHHYVDAFQGFAATVPRAQVAQWLASMATDPAVQSVTLDRVARADSVPPRPLTSGITHWGLDRIDQRSAVLDLRFAPAATGKGVTAYVVDSGTSAHAEFGTRLLAGANFMGDGRDASDCNGHGTHVASTIAGTVTGVAPEARIVPVRVLGCQNIGSGTGILAGLDWVLANATGPSIVNLSLGFNGPWEPVDRAVQKLVDAGITVVAAAGNSNVDACGVSPARAPAALTIGASDHGGARTSFSNYGTCLDLFAPGVMIYAASFLSNTGFVYKSGTSMASPHVAGAVALQLETSPTATPAAIAARLRDSATPGALSAGTLGSGSPNRLLFVGETGMTVPAARAVHVADLAVTATVSGATWRPTVALRAVDAQGLPVAGATATFAVAGARLSPTCTTGTDGRCSAALPDRSLANKGGLSVSVVTLQGSNLVRAAAADQVKVASLATPVVGMSVATLSASTSVSATRWTPAAQVQVLSDQGQPVAGVRVQATTTTQALVCTTRADGRCTLTASARARAGSTTVTLTLKSLTAATHTHRAELDRVRAIDLRP